VLSDNGPNHINFDMASRHASYWTERIRGAPRHPHTQGKIGRWHTISKLHQVLRWPEVSDGEKLARH
jgi:hypothetical protein